MNGKNKRDGDIQSYFQKKCKKNNEEPSTLSFAENHIIHKFPERIAYLNELLKKPEFSISENDLKCSLELPAVYKLGNHGNTCDGKNPSKILDSNSYSESPGQSRISSNKNLSEAFKIVRPNIQQFIEDIKAVKMWVSLLIPKIEDGNNFGVTVQEETLNVILQVENVGFEYLKIGSTYYKERARLVTKTVKYPYVADYRLAVDDLDKSTCLFMAIAMHEIRNHYSLVHGIVMKNFDKIKRPQSSNTDCFY